MVPNQHLFAGPDVPGGLACFHLPCTPAWNEGGLLAIVRETTVRVLATQAIQERCKYRPTVNTVNEGYAIMIELVHDTKGGIADLVFREVNRAFVRHTRLIDVAGRTVRRASANSEGFWTDACTRSLAPASACGLRPTFRTWTAGSRSSSRPGSCGQALGQRGLQRRHQALPMCRGAAPRKREAAGVAAQVERCPATTHRRQTDPRDGRPPT